LNRDHVRLLIESPQVEEEFGEPVLECESTRSGACCTSFDILCGALSRKIRMGAGGAVVGEGGR
jgi:hypothetical protein